MTSSNQKTSAAQVNFNLHSLRDDSENFNFQTKISDDKVGSGMREYLFFSRICLGGSNNFFGKAPRKYQQGLQKHTNPKINKNIF